MKPHPELVLDYSQPFCLANPSKDYLLYLRYGGYVKLKMNKEEAENTYTYFWYDPSNGKRYETRQIHGKEILNFSCPENYPGVEKFRDWVLYIKKQ